MHGQDWIRSWSCKKLYQMVLYWSVTVISTSTSTPSRARVIIQELYRQSTLCHSCKFLDKFERSSDTVGGEHWIHWSTYEGLITWLVGRPHSLNCNCMLFRSLGGNEITTIPPNSWVGLTALQSLYTLHTLKLYEHMCNVRLLSYSYVKAHIVSISIVIVGMSAGIYTVTCCQTYLWMHGMVWMPFALCKLHNVLATSMK